MLEEKYPDEKALDYFRKYDTLKGDIDVFLSEIEGEWWAPDWGFKKTKRKNKIYLQLHTGGWSGNEDIISALQRNITFWRFWKKEIVGGHYYFEITR